MNCNSEFVNYDFIFKTKLELHNVNPQYLQIISLQAYSQKTLIRRL